MVTDISLQQKNEVSYGGAALFSLSALVLNRIIKDSRLTVICQATRQVRTVGQGHEGQFTIVVRDPQTLWQFVTNPDPGAGELFMEQKWSMGEGDIGAFITMMARNLQAALDGPVGFFLASVLRKRLHERSWDIKGSRDCIHHHYDLGNNLYESFLDGGLNYSCAFFEGAQMSLRDAQLNKIRTTIRRLGIRPGMKVLDIGCGWGEACRIAASETGAAEVTGITLSEQQLDMALDRAQGMARPPAYLLEDYREHAETHREYYDRIFSIGMFEHVGENQYRAYFAAIRRQLADNGRALVHSIVNASMKPGQSLNSPWLETYIFPGGRIPDLPEIFEAARLEGLALAHKPYMQPSSDYAETLRRWRANFMRNAHTLDAAQYDDRFYRMWIYYFALCEAMFEGCGFQVAQMVFQKAY